MNPIIIFILFILLYQDNNHFPNYYDTFKLEQLLDKLNFAVHSLDRINHLNELAHEPLEKGRIADTLEDSIHTVKPLLPEGKSQQSLESIASVIEGMRKIGGLQNMAQSLGPIMGMLNNLSGDSSSENSFSALSYPKASALKSENSYHFEDEEGFEDTEHAAAFDPYGSIDIK